MLATVKSKQNEVDSFLMRRFILSMLILPLLIGSAGAIFTWNKLEDMKQIRGFSPGATVRTYVVRDKWIRSPNVYLLTLTNQDIHRPNLGRLNLPEAVWNEYDIDEEIEIVSLPNDSSFYHRDGIYASDSNFEFDYKLLYIELGMVSFSVFGFLTMFVIIYRAERVQKKNMDLNE